MAQLVAQLIRNQQVRGSSPLVGSKKTALKGGFLLRKFNTPSDYWNKLFQKLIRAIYIDQLYLGCPLLLLPVINFCLARCDIFVVRNGVVRLCTVAASLYRLRRLGTQKVTEVLVRCASFSQKGFTAPVLLTCKRVRNARVCYRHFDECALRRAREANLFIL